MRKQAGRSSLGSAIALGILFGIFLVLLQEAWIGHRIAAQYQQTAEVPGLLQQPEQTPGTPQSSSPSVQPNQQLPDDTTPEATPSPVEDEPEESAPPEPEYPAGYSYTDEGAAIIQTEHGEFILDFAWLVEENPDFVGWLMFPNLDISYPMVQGEDNDYYLKHLFSGGYSDLGTIFVDFRNRMLEDEHTMVYGHNFHNYGVMLSKLVNYKKQDFYDANPVAYLLTEDGGYTLEVFSAYEVAVTDPIYTLTFQTRNEFGDLLKYVQEKSAVQTSVELTAADKILTFSTCSNVNSAGRFVVVCRVAPFEYPAS